MQQCGNFTPESHRVYRATGVKAPLVYSVSIVPDNATLQRLLTCIMFLVTQIVESSGPLGKGQKRKAGQLNKAITIGSSPILYTQPAASAGKQISLHNICSYSKY